MNRSPRLLRTLTSTLAGALAGTAYLVGGSLAPAHAADGVVTVTGFDYAAAGLTYIAESCVSDLTPAPTRATQLYRAGGTAGAHATGITFGGATGSEAGVLATVARPSTLSSVRVDTLTPAGPDADAAADGHFVVKYDVYANGYASYFYAYLPVDVAHTGWGTSTDLASVPLTWTWYDGKGGFVGGYPQWTVAQMASYYGDGGGALVGFEFGCNGRDYFMDSFTVASAAGRTLYDFEGHESLTVLATHAQHHNHDAEAELGVERVEIVAGQGHWLGGASGDAAHMRMGHRAWLSGVMTLMQQTYGTSAFLPQGTPMAFSDTAGAWIKIYPKRRTTYYFAYGGDDAYRSSTSLPVRIDVRRWMSASASHRTVLRGRPITVTGRIEPGDKRVRTRLQLKDGRRWRTVDSTRTRAKGRYALATRPGRAGVARYRVVVAAADGNLGNVSPTMKITVKKPTPKPAPPPRRDDSVDVTTYVPEVEDVEEVRVPTDDIPARPFTEPSAPSHHGSPARLVDRHTDPAPSNAPAKAR